MVFPRFPQGRDCVIPLSGGPVLAEDGFDSRTVLQDARHPVRGFGVEVGWRAGAGGVAVGAVARGVVLGRAVDLQCATNRYGVNPGDH